jgi:uncharacterized protein DUF3352
VQRLVVALTTFLTLIAGVVVAGYLVVFAASPDRAARAVPAGTAVYGTLYLQPSAGQKMNLAALLGHVPGLGDATSLDGKLHEMAGQLLSQGGLDYAGDLRPWLGDQVSLAIEPDGIDPSQARFTLLVAVKDPAAARAALERIAADLQLTGEPESYHGVEVTVASDGAWTLLDDLLVVGRDAATVRAALDADADRAPSLADDVAFVAAMRRVPPDHLASIYVDLQGVGGAAGLEEQVGGYTNASLALVVEPDGLHLAGNAPFDAAAASAGEREAFALGGEPSSLPAWMPDGTQAELVVFGLAQALHAAEGQLGADSSTAAIADLVTQLRAVAALGFGINVDEDLLPLFDGEAAIAVGRLANVAPSIQLLLRPSDADAAQGSLDSMVEALRGHGSTVSESQRAGLSITSVSVPDLGEVSYGLRDGIIVAALDPAEVSAAFAAADDGGTLAASPRYASAWELAGAHAGSEFWVDVAALVDAAGDGLGVSGDVRAILLEIDALAMTAPARDRQSEVHLVLTAR